MPMREYNIDVWLLQPLQTRLQAFYNVLLGKPPRIGFAAPGAKKDFGDEDVFVTRPGEFL